MSKAFKAWLTFLGIIVLIAAGLYALALWPSEEEEAPNLSTPRLENSSEEKVSEEQKQAAQQLAALRMSRRRQITVGSGPAESDLAQRLRDFDPTLLETHEDELRQTLIAHTPSLEQAAAVAQIARFSLEESTKLVAIEALGRMHETTGNKLLVELLQQGIFKDQNAVRRKLLENLRPKSLSDPDALQMIGLLDQPTLLEKDKKQIAFALAHLAAQKNQTLGQATRQGMSAKACQLFDEQLTLAQVLAAQKNKPKK